MAKTDSSSLSYFDLRNVKAKDYSGYKIPKFIIEIILTDKNFHILDFGCGYGAFLLDLHEKGYKNIEGADIDARAIQHNPSLGLCVHQVKDLKKIPTSKKLHMTSFS
jgi:SAM-dependent methyltransferase